MSRGVSATGEIYLPPGEREELRREVEQCDKETDSTRASGDQRQLLVRLERGLYLRRRLYAESSEEVASACRRLCEVCNCAATSMLQQGNMRAAHDLLQRAEQVAEKSELDRAITWNNLACYYRRAGKLRTAVSFLERALAIEEHLRDADAAQTHLNLCATLSQLKRHTEALNHAHSALIRIYENLTPLMLRGQLSLNPSSTTKTEDNAEQVTVLCIAYHNLAVEHEYLKNLEAALCAYAEGVRWAKQFLPEGHQLVGIMTESVEALKAKLPPTSGALARAGEMMEGWRPAPEAQESARDSFKGDHLLTPRDDDRAGSPRASPRGGGSGRSTPRSRGSSGTADRSGRGSRSSRGDDSPEGH